MSAPFRSLLNCLLLVSVAALATAFVSEPAFEAPGSEPREFTNLFSRLVFAARPNPPGPLELWSTDGTARGTRRLAPGVTYSGILAELPGAILWIGQDSTRAVRVWVTEGTPRSTRPLLPYDFWLNYSGISRVKDGAFLATHDRDGRLVLWKTDARARRVSKVHDFGGDLIWCRSYFPEPNQGLGPIQELDGRVVFFLRRHNEFCQNEAFEIWVSDGSDRGTRRLVSLDPARLFYPSPLRVGNHLVFATPEGGLWVTDGTPGGTIHLRTFDSGQPFVSGGLWSVEGRAVVSADDGVHGPELWSLDPKHPKLRRITDLPSDAVLSSEFLMPLVSVQGNLVFSAYTPRLGRELWSTNGAPQSTRVLRDVCPGPCGSAYNIHQLVPLPGGRAIFFANDGRHGVEPWTTDGTRRGTRILADLCPGDCDSGYVVRPAGGSLYFHGFDPKRGWELWTTDGTVAGTRPVTDFFLDQPFRSSWFGRLGDAVVLSATDGFRGEEPWISEGDPPRTRILADLAR